MNDKKRHSVKCVVREKHQIKYLFQTSSPFLPNYMRGKNMEKEEISSFVGKKVFVGVPHRVFGDERPFFHEGIITQVNTESVKLLTLEGKMMLLKISWILEVVEK